MSPAAARRVVDRRTGEANPLAIGFSGHSLRVGAAQDLLAAGVDLPGLMQAGRWSSPIMPARYTERLRRRGAQWLGCGGERTSKNSGRPKWAGRVDDPVALTNLQFMFSLAAGPLIPLDVGDVPKALGHAIKGV